MLEFTLFYSSCFLAVLAALLCLKAQNARRCLALLMVFIISTAALFALLGFPVLGGCYFAAGCLLALLAFMALEETNDDIYHALKFNETWLAALLACAVFVSFLSYLIKTLGTGAKAPLILPGDIQAFMLIMFIVLVTAGAAAFLQ